MKGILDRIRISFYLGICFIKPFIASRRTVVLKFKGTQVKLLVAGALVAIKVMVKILSQTRINIGGTGLNSEISG